MRWVECQPLDFQDLGTVVQLLCLAKLDAGTQRIIAVDFDRRSWIGFLEGLERNEAGQVVMPSVLWCNDDGSAVRLSEPVEAPDAIGG